MLYVSLSITQVPDPLVSPRSSQFGDGLANVPNVKWGGFFFFFVVWKAGG